MRFSASLVGMGKLDYGGSISWEGRARGGENVSSGAPGEVRTAYVKVRTKYGSRARLPSSPSPSIANRAIPAAPQRGQAQPGPVPRARIVAIAFLAETERAPFERTLTAFDADAERCFLDRPASAFLAAFDKPFLPRPRTTLRAAAFDPIA